MNRWMEELINRGEWMNGGTEEWRGMNECMNEQRQ